MRFSILRLQVISVTCRQLHPQLIPSLNRGGEVVFREREVVLMRYPECIAHPGARDEGREQLLQLALPGSPQVLPTILAWLCCGDEGGRP